MGMMGMFKWLRKDIIPRDRNGWHIAQKHCSLNNESYRNALQAFIDRRRFTDDAPVDAEQPCSPDKHRADFLAKNNNNHENNKKCDNKWKSQDSKSAVPGVPHIAACEIFEIGWVPGTEDRYLELIFAEWQNTRVSLKRHTHPECRDAVKADLEVLSEIRHPNVLLLMATTQTDDHGLVSIFESVDCTLYNYIHEQGERLCIHSIATCSGKLSDALRHSHMRGYIHGAISSHCVYLASSGVVKLGGWELAVNSKNPKPVREYGERLRAEIFRWQAPEVYYGCQPCKESDVYGLALLIWEMCTMHVPWSGYSRADVERQYVHWKRGVIMDLYDFPPLLNNLLEAGLQLDVAKRTLDMNRMRRFLQRLELQYEDTDPVYIDQCVNNNNENKYPIGGSKLKRLTKSASAKQLCHVSRASASATTVAESPSKLHLFAKNVAPKEYPDVKASSKFEGLNSFDVREVKTDKVKEDAGRNMDVIYNMKNMQKSAISISGNSDEPESYYQDCSHSPKPQPWNATYKKVTAPKEIESTSVTTSVHSISSGAVESTDESYKDARTILKEIKEVLADRREHFFYGSDSSHSSEDNSSKNKILAQARSTDYEPHKPASHKTSLEPKYNKSPGQYDPSYMKSSFQQYYKLPFPSKDVRDSVVQPHLLHPNSENFFETSLWRKEKLICISKMRKSQESDQGLICAECPNDSDPVDSSAMMSRSLKTEFAPTNNTYVISGTSQEGVATCHKVSTQLSRETDETSEMENFANDSLQTLKNALDRATEIVRSATPNTEDSCSSPPFKTYQTFDVTVDDVQDRRIIFENIYDLKADETGEIRSIERSETNNETLLQNEITNSIRDTDFTRESGCEADKSSSTYGQSSQLPYDATYTRSFVCESIAEVSSESNTSQNSPSQTGDSMSTITKEIPIQTENDTRTVCLTSAKATSTDPKTEIKMEVPSKENKSVVTNLTLMLMNDRHNKNCKSCNHSALPRRRSLPAALGQLRVFNNSALGKLPIRRAGVPDSTVEDLYIDDEFGDSLNVNMILLDEELSFDEDFLPDISEL